MPIQTALTHRTSYRYDRPIQLGPQTIRLRPAPHARTPILSYSLKVEPTGHFINWQQDPQGNFLARLVFPEPVEHFQVTIDLVADMTTINPFDFFLDPEAETWPFGYDPLLDQELAPFRRLLEPGPLLAQLLAELPRQRRRTVDLLVELNTLIQRRIAYIVRMEPGVQTPEETLALGKGSCRDSAWLMVQFLRHLGFAARFVSGYLIQLVPDIEPLVGPKGPSADFTDLHAWAEAYLPGAGWIGLDATSGLLTGEGHIPLAATPAPASAAPIAGELEECETEFDFAMAVTRLHETPRVTKPYTPVQWQAIRAAGDRIDALLTGGDVRLSFGGEPTFVADSDIDAPEWNTAALGPTKRRYAGKLIRRLAPLWSAGSALQYAMGKQYPGEQLPRWAILNHWRGDGEPVWREPSLLDDPDDRQGDLASEPEAARFCAALAERLQVDPGLAQPAYEDVHYYLWREHRLPANVLVEDSKLSDQLERERLAKVYGQGLASPIARVLPLRRAYRDGVRRWQSGKWFFRGDTMFLIPGDSPAGFRLPLESLPWADPSRLDFWVDPQPLEVKPPLPTRQALIAESAQARVQPFPLVEQQIPIIGRDALDTVRTALVVEPRDGCLFVFLPPVETAEDWLALIMAVEDTAQNFGRPVVLEGYPPPIDSRLLNFSVTPDPGVIEVNIHPAANWPELVGRTSELYEQARQVGLRAEKFMLDGRHVGTGGGNHVVMGAMHAADSPFLRRPDLLKSLLGFWHNHPSLSYLFSGQFIGPTSQHPRIDEARQDVLAELEIAFSQASAAGRTPSPWVTDRLFRNILTDLTGNTHRTEFCIDKMYAPESSGGRRGLVEFRAFEMPPHAEMSAAQMLLMRAAIAAFWRSPYERRLIRWGTRIHDQFMLPHYVGEDFAEVLAELGALGCPIDPSWFAPHHEFRFPLIGEIGVAGAQVELRHALEPWHVMGEEPGGGGTVRYVDSSVERVQAKVSGWVDERYILACNGIAVPLSPTDRQGEYVAGVRFKAWQPPSGLHPTIRLQTPLVFDVYDSWNGRSVGGMTCHVAHPGGRNYERFPVNANEAEARRRSLFLPLGHTPGAMPKPPAAIGFEHPRTLDLRRFIGSA
jgi:uncharacterized protein (DUF2126 family)/transglutaminase-like putative cysteine protease